MIVHKVVSNLNKISYKYFYENVSRSIKTVFTAETIPQTGSFGKKKSILGRLLCVICEKTKNKRLTRHNKNDILNISL